MDTEANMFDIHITTNFKKLAFFNFEDFDLQEIIFFQFLVVYCQNGEFFHSENQIKSELGIKKDKQKTIVRRFKNLGILIKEVRRDPLTRTYYTLDFKEIINSEFIYRIYNLDKSDVDFEKIECVFQQFAEKQEKRNLLLLESRNIGKDSKPNINHMFQELQQVFKDRREMHNKGEGSLRKLQPVTLIATKSNKTQLIKAINIYTFSDIKYAFTAYCDDLNKKAEGNTNTKLKEYPDSVLGYFLMNEGGEFYKIDMYLSIFATKYGSNKN